MLTLQTLLADPPEPDMFFLEGDATPDSIREIVEQAGYNFFHLNGKSIRNKLEFLAESQKVFRFPSYFGNNWDAWTDCMRDLAWILPAKGNVTLYDTFERFADNAPTEFQIALDVLKYAAQPFEPIAGAQPIYVLLRGDRSVLDNFEDAFQLVAVDH